MNRVVVTGIGALTPIGNNVEEFWQGLISGKNGVDKITYFDTTDYKAKVAAQLKDFTPSLRLDKTTIRKTDLFVQYALYSAIEAMEDSGIEGNIDGEDIGVYFSSGIGGFNTFCDEHSILLESGPRKVSPLLIPKMIGNIGAGNVAIRFQAKGPCMSLLTACASSTTAIGEAFRLIKHGYAKAMIAGGSEATIHPLAMAGFSNAFALSESDDPNAASLPFDNRRGGFVMGEGGGTLILEEYEHAVNRGAKIYGEIVGYGSTCDAYHVTASDPATVASAKAVRDAIKEGNCENIPPSKIYINAHGTGTKMNDSTETKMFKTAFGEEGARELHISSTKSMTGHMLGAAGAAEGIAAILALKEGVIPPTINCIEKDEECDLNYTPLKAVSADIELALSTSLGFGGHNACIAFKKI